jgi:uncharacterized protein (TIGR00251 family)
MTERIPRGVVEQGPDGALLTLNVVPRASRTALVCEGEGLKLRVAAPPVDGEANAEVVRFLCKLLGVPKADVAILSGFRGRSKRVLIRGHAEARVRELLAAALPVEKG